MEILIAAGIASLVILAFAVGIDTGVKLGRGDLKKTKPQANATHSPGTESAEPSEEEKRRFEEDQKAFARCMNYSPEQAYGNSN